ncbi:MAG TPA: hypothetical protein VIU40_03285 [Geobacteraceae bacterium]
MAAATMPKDPGADDGDDEDNGGEKEKYLEDVVDKEVEGFTEAEAVPKCEQIKHEVDGNTLEHDKTL